jgi:hypothetical protein
MKIVTAAQRGKATNEFRTPILLGKKLDYYDQILEAT